MESAKNGEETGKGRLIMLPVDGSSTCERAFQWYLDHLRRKSDRLAIVNIIEPPVVPDSFILMGPSMISEGWKREVEKSVVKSKETAARFEERCKKENVPCRVLTETSDAGPGQRICELAKEVNASAIVVGSRGQNLIRRTLLGSVASYVVDHADIPVVVTPKVNQNTTR
ncbi:universal stress protein Slr1101-like [Rhopilema esculentum]|uniref:universal stress protein Slr1101-like n=1 Tax=Rhopilema esculentum TaxID=499914 RepID=UPI0031CDED75|eukprot:gene862-10611_t